MADRTIEALTFDDVPFGSPAEHVIVATNPVIHALNEFVEEHRSVLLTHDREQQDCIRLKTLDALRTLRYGMMAVEKAVIANLISNSDLPHHNAHSRAETEQV